MTGLLALLWACGKPSAETVAPTPPADTGPTDPPIETGGDTGGDTEPIGTITARAAQAGVMVHAWTVTVELDPPGPVSVVCASDDEPGEVLTPPPLDEAARHDVDVAGLLADHAYTCTATSGLRVASVAVRTAPLPDDLPAPTLIGAPTAAAGWTVYSWMSLGADFALGVRLLVVDPLGRPRWTLAHPSDVLLDVDLGVYAGTLVFGGGSGGSLAGADPLATAPRQYDVMGRLLWQGQAVDDGGAYHHHVDRLADGYLVLTSGSEIGPDGTSRIGGALRLLDPMSGATAWSWTTERGVADGALSPDHPLWVTDPYHLNWATRRADGVSLVSAKNQARVIAIDPDGSVRWVLGEGGDFALYAPDGSPLADDAWFADQHGLYLDGDRLWVYDNTHHTESGAESRAIALDLDEAARTATLAWSWTQPGWLEPIFGSVQPLSNGNVLIGIGHCEGCYAFPDGVGDGPSRILEVDPAGASPWGLWFPTEDDAIYRAKRVDGCALFHHAGMCVDAG